MNKWLLVEAAHILRGLESVANQNGFLLAAYGSTVRNSEGRDLDLIAVQKRLNVSPQYFLKAVADRLGGVVEVAESSMFAEVCALIRLPDDRLIDIQIRLSKCAPKDAHDLYIQCDGQASGLPPAIADSRIPPGEVWMYRSRSPYVDGTMQPRNPDAKLTDISLSKTVPDPKSPKVPR